MAEKYVTAIRTVDGDKQIDYEALANKPISKGVATELIALYGDPIEGMHAVTKKYCDSHYDSINQEINIINTIKIPDIYDKITEMYNRIAALEEKVEELSSSSGGGDTSGDDNPSGGDTPGDDNTPGDSTLLYKYNFAIETKKVPYTYYIDDGSSVNGGTSNTVSGYTDYMFDPTDGTYTMRGDYVTLTSGVDNGTVYTGGGSSIMALTPLSTGGYAAVKRYATEKTGYDEETIHTVGSLVGTVYVKEGAYPDAENGYTYVMDYTYNGVEYIIMQNENVYYAYSQSEGESSGGSGSDTPVDTSVTWSKYSVNAIAHSEYVETATTPTPMENVSYWSDSNFTLYTGYKFSSAFGYSGTGGVQVNGANASGYYHVSNTEVVSIGEMVSESPSDDGTYNICYYSATLEAQATLVEKYLTYNKGTTSYGEISAENGAVPEGGTLIDGSVTGSYCVVTVNGTNYYYEKVTS